MNNIKIIKTGKYIPKNKITNKELNERFGLEDGWILKRTGINTRYVASESIEEIAIKAVDDLFENDEKLKKNIDLILVATTSTTKLMPGISFLIQKHLKIEKCMCFDILAGCSGSINAIDIAKKYIQSGDVNKALIIGVDKLSEFVDKDDIDTSILLADGAGCLLIEKVNETKLYDSNIESIGINNDILTCNLNEKIKMNGKEIYKFAVRKSTENIKEILEKNKINISEIKYIISHQSNIRIIENIADRLNISMDKFYINLDKIGNTFCASIFICLDEMIKSKCIEEKDKIILIGYGGGLNLGSILLEV